MPRTCKVCSHVERTEIDLALVNGQSYRDIEKRFAVSRSSLLRHRKNDISKSLVLAKQADDQVEATSLFGRMKEINQETLEILLEARNTENHVICLKAIARVESQIELEARLLGQLNNGTGSKVVLGVNINMVNTVAEFRSLSNEQLAQKAEQIAQQLRSG